MFMAEATVHAAGARPTGPEIDPEFGTEQKPHRRHAFAIPIKNLAEQLQ
jgi:hypothetical protein